MATQTNKMETESMKQRMRQRHVVQVKAADKDCPHPATDGALTIKRDTSGRRAHLKGNALQTAPLQ